MMHEGISSEQRIAFPGPLGGAAGEAGSVYRAGIGAYFVANGLCGRPVDGLDLPAQRSVPRAIAVEVDAPVDDLCVEMEGGGLVHIGAKVEMNFGRGRFATEVLDQWMKQVATGKLDSEKDRLVLAVQRPSANLRTLAAALHRRRRIASGRARSYAPKEAGVFDRLSALIDDLSLEETVQLLDSAVILPLDVIDETQQAVTAASTLLDGHVVRAGQGPAAFEVIARSVVDLGRRRERLDIEHDKWSPAFSSAGLELVVSADRSARFEGVAENYRAGLRREGSQIDLRPLGVELPLIPVQAPGTDLVVEEVEGDDHSADLLHALRRCGRLLLVGLPGGGKTVALRQVAAYAATHDWPVPVLVRLDSLARRLPVADPLGEVLQIAAERMPPEGRETTVDWLRHSALQGGLLLLLDGLDECREQVGAVCEVLGRLLRDLHPDAEAIVSTRPLSAGMGRTLPLRAVEIRPPRSLRETMREIARLLAVKSRIKSEEFETWIDDRLQWVEQHSGSDEALRSTPLMPILLLLLGRRATGSLRTRGDVLGAVVDDVVERWEIKSRRFGELAVGALRGRVAVEAVRRGLEIISHATHADGIAPARHVMQSVTEELREEFGVAGRAASAAAVDILAFWDEAGIFIRDDERGEVAARTRLFEEIGEARFGMSLAADELEEWVRGHLEKPASEETLVLAASLNLSIASDVVRQAALHDDARIHLLGGRVIAEEPDVGEAAVHAIADRLRPHLRQERRLAWDAAQMITQLPLRDPLVASLLDEFGSLEPPDYALVARVLGTIRWDIRAREADDVLERILHVEHPPRLKVAEDHPLAIAAIDSGYASAVKGAASRLLPTRPELASVVAEATKRLARADREDMEALLGEHGHGKFVSRKRKREFSSTRQMMQWIEVDQRGWDRFAEIVAHLGRPIPLDYRKRRRLDELVALVSTLRICNSPAGWLPVASLKHEDELRVLLPLLLSLTGLDIDVVSSEMRSLREDSDLDGQEERFLFVGLPVPRDFDRWEDLPDAAAAIKQLVHLFPIHPWFRHLAMSALADCPDSRLCARELAPLLEAKDPEIKEDAALLIGWHERTDLTRLKELSGSDDPHVRREIGFALAAEWGADPQAARPLCPLVKDADLGVRERTREGFGDSSTSEPVRRAMADAERIPAKGWSCRQCGSWNEISVNSCRSCKRGPGWRKRDSAGS